MRLSPKQRRNAHTPGPPVYRAETAMETAHRALQCILVARKLPGWPPGNWDQHRCLAEIRWLLFVASLERRRGERR